MLMIQFMRHVDAVEEDRVERSEGFSEKLAHARSASWSCRRGDAPIAARLRMRAGRVAIHRLRAREKLEIERAVLGQADAG